MLYPIINYRHLVLASLLLPGQFSVHQDCMKSYQYEQSVILDLTLSDQPKLFKLFLCPFSLYVILKITLNIQSLFSPFRNCIFAISIF